MASKYIIKFAAVSKFFEGHSKLIDRGENAVESGHVKNMEYKEELRLLKGEVFASMKLKFYNIEVNFNGEGDIISAKCTCPKGKMLCHHMAALLLFARSNISVTDKHCAWSTRKTPQDDVVQTCSELYPQKHNFEAVSDMTVIDEAIADFNKNLINHEAAIGFAWLLSPDYNSQNKLCVDVEDILFSKGYYNAINKVEFLRTECALSEEDIPRIHIQTIGQIKNENWLVVRKNRITASRFGIVLQACRRNKYPPSLFKSLAGCYNLDGVKAIQWGRDNEEQAITAFSKKFGIGVAKSGVWLDISGFLGASPDGLIGDDAVLEVKCPFKYKNSGIKQALKNDNSYFIYQENTTLHINPNHNYYHQVQGQLFLTNRQRCIFVVWTPLDSINVTIEKDDNWANNLNILRSFYENHYVKYLCGK